MARKKDLGGLAALAGLAYMASRDKATKGEAREAPSSDDVASFAGTPENDSNAGMTPEAGMMEKEPGWDSGKAPARRNTRVAKPKDMGDESYNPDVKQRLKDDQYNPAVKQRSASTPNILEEAKEAVRRGNAARASMSAAERQMEVGRLPKKGPGLSNFKSGGSVKGWGIARGARKAKTY